MKKLAVVLLLFACGGADDAREAPGCAPRTGVYRVTFDLLSGDCGAFVAQTTLVDDVTPLAERGWTGALTTSADNCEVVSERAGPSGLSWSGTLRWDADASLGSGTMVHEVDMPGYSCRGTYGVTYARATDGLPKT